MQVAYLSRQDYRELRTIVRAKIWSVSKDLRPGLSLTLSRVKGYVAEGLAKDSWTTELECAGQTLTIADCSNADNANFLLGGWFKILDKLLAKYELESNVSKPKKIADADDFAKSIVASPKYKELCE